MTDIKIPNNAAHVISSNVPCPFSDTGKHPIRLFLTAENDLITATSKCLEDHGQLAVEGMNGLTEENSVVTCSQLVNAVFDLVRSKEATILRGKYAYRVDSPNAMLQSPLQTLYDSAHDKRNRRYLDKNLRVESFHEKIKPLNALRDKLHLDKIKLELEKEPIDVYDTTSTMQYSVAIKLNRYTIAKRNNAGEISIMRGVISDLAPEFNQISAKQPENYCVACKNTYDRMPTHLSSGSHKKKMKQFLINVCELFSKEGIKKLNREGLQGFAPKNKRKKRRKRDPITGELLPREEAHGRLYPF